MSAPRLLFLVNIPRFFVSHRLPLAVAARAAGYDVHVATATDDGTASRSIVDAGLTWHPIRLDQHGTRPTRELVTLIDILRLLRRLRPDLLHTVTIKPVLYGGLAARLTGVRGVVAALSGLGRTFRDEQGEPRLPGGALRATLRSALPATTTRVLLQNEDDAGMLVRSGIVRPDRVHVVPGSGVDLDRFHPPSTPRDTSATPTFLLSGRMMWQKGVGEFVELARRLGDRGRFLVAGYSEDGSPDMVPDRQLEEWAAAGTIEWLGNHPDVPALLRRVDVVVLPSTYGEGVPKALIEAAAAGCAIITTDTPGCRDICRDGVNGLLVTPRDVDGLERAARTLAADPALRERMGLESRRIAERGFGLDSVIARTLDIYAELGGTRP